MEKLSDADFSNKAFPWLTAQQISVGIAPVTAARVNFVGEYGWELHHPIEMQNYLFDILMEAGAEFGLKPFGIRAMDSMRLEKSYRLIPTEMSIEYSALETGLDRFVRLDKEDDFIGRDALVRRKASPNRKLVGLQLEGGEIGANGDTVHVGRAQVGEITSGCMSPILRKNIALCRMAIEYADIGMEVEVGKIDGHQKRIPATVIEFPFYDPTKSRVRGEN